MKNVYDGVSDQMIQRSRKWLLDKRDGKGGFNITTARCHSWGASDVISSYILWALSEAEVSGIDKELYVAIKKAKNQKDPYQLALLANACYNLNKTIDGDDLVSHIEDLILEDCYWTGADRSVTNSMGASLQVETTALAVLAMIKGGKEYGEILPSINFLLAKRSGVGRFGSTQATVLALKAITEFYGLNEEQIKEGEKRL